MSNSIRELIRDLKKDVSTGTLTEEAITAAIKTLDSLGHDTYNFKKFPQLVNTSSFNDVIGDTPASLAEALLWKLGKWQTYKTFVQSYKDKDLEVSAKGGVVFSAFAKHLQNNDFPIYDQHAIRAIWAICDLEESDKKLCQALLVDSSGGWKQAGSGDDGACYMLFVSHVEKICKMNNVKHRTLDLLLMPLGQALKKVTRTEKKSIDKKSEFQRFEELCRGNG